MVKKEDIFKILYEICDPEIPLDIVNLGLVKDVEIDNDIVNIKMTLTTPKCPLEYLIKAMIINKIKEKFPQLDVNITLVFDSPWNTEKISEEGKRKLRELGWSV